MLTTEPARRAAAAGGSIRWGRTLLGAVYAEIALIVLSVPLYALGSEGLLIYVIPPAAFVASYAAGIWVARATPGRAMLHGFLTGVWAVLIYLPLPFFMGESQPAAYLLAHALKVAGGTLGGYIVARRAGA